MPSPVVIRAENVSKRYVISHLAKQQTIRDAMHHGLRLLWRRLRWQTKLNREEFWALKDVSFEVKQGEVVGIIGRNGAGKSTLLKIFSRITEPTTGSISITGRVASLLEVGTGFHPELTGRENILLNGAILGMARAEVRDKFDEIVAFAEIERFIDTPVKRYSSGMYVRLAFAVAAHLEPEILIVDEVLAVGDVAFQKKCIGKIESVSNQQGRTVLFVSHSLQTIRQLCTSSILLHNGRIHRIGRTSEVLETFSSSLFDTAARTIPAPSEETLGHAYVTDVKIETLDGTRIETAPVGIPWVVRLNFRIARPMDQFVASIGLVTLEGAPAQTAWSKPEHLTSGSYEIIFIQDRVILAVGSYQLLVGLSNHEHTIQQVSVARLDILDEGAKGYFQRTSSVGTVLNSMSITLCKKS